MGDVSNWQAGRQTSIAPPPPNPDRRANPMPADLIALAEVQRLNDRFFRDNPIDPQEAVFGLGPSAGPERTARELEDRLGRLDDIPSWANARQFADAAVDYTTNNSDQPASYWRDRASQWVMHPDRYYYMQVGPGRAVDLLSNLRSDPVRAREFFERSEGARTTRDGYTDPNYQRYSGFEPAAAEFISSPLSGIGRYLQWQSIIPQRINHGVAGATPEQAYGIANARDIAAQRFRQGEVPIMDIASPMPGESRSEYAERYFARQDPVSRDIAAMQPSSDEDLGRGLFGKSAPPVVGYGAGMVIGAADATAPVSLLGGLAATPAKAMARTAATAAAKTAGVPYSAARRMIERSARVFPEDSVLQRGQRVAGYRGVTAQEYKDALTRPTVAELAGTAGKSIAVNEGVPEVAVEGGIASMLPQEDRTWREFLFGTPSSESDSDFRARQAERIAAADRAAARTEALSNDPDKNNIWNELYRAQAERRQKEAATQRLKDMSSSGPAGSPTDYGVWGP